MSDVFFYKSMICLVLLLLQLNFCWCWLRWLWSSKSFLVGDAVILLLLYTFVVYIMMYVSMFIVLALFCFVVLPICFYSHGHNIPCDEFISSLFR